MKNLILITSTFPYYPGEQFIETEIKYLSEYFDVVYIVPLGGKENKEPRSLPSNVKVLSEVKTFRARSKRDPVSRFFALIKTFAAIKTEIGSRKSLFLSHPKALFALLKCASSAGQIMPILKLIFQQYQPSLVYSYWLSTGALAACLELEKLGASHPLISRCHRYDIYEERHNPPYCPFQRYMLSKLKSVLPISEQGRDYLKRKYPDVTSSNIKTFRLGVSPGPAAQISKDKTLRLVSCSFMVPVKRIHLIANALRYINFPVLWTHIGDGPLQNELDKVASQLTTEKSNIRVNLLGSKTNQEVLAYYDSHPVDLFINVSESEGIPVSIMEAVSRSIPIIATDVGGTSEIVDAKEGLGFLVPEDVTAEEIAQYLGIFYKMSEFGKKGMKYSAFQTWYKKFNAEINYREFCQFLISLCE